MKKLLVACLLCCLAAQANAGSLVVPDSVATIRGGVITAASGDTVLVKAGTYANDIILSGDWEDDIWLLPYGDGTVTVTVTGAGGHAIDMPNSGLTGCGISGITFSNTSGGTGEICFNNTNNASDFTVNGCVFTGFHVILEGGGSTMHRIVLSNNTFDIDAFKTGATASPFYIFGNSHDWVISGNTFDFRDATITDGDQNPQFEIFAAQYWTWADNVFYAPDYTGSVSSNHQIVHLRAASDVIYSTGGIFERNTFYNTDPGSGKTTVSLYIGIPPGASGDIYDGVDSVQVRLNQFLNDIDPVGDIYSVDFECVVVDCYIESPLMEYNYASGGERGLLFSEGVIYGRAIGNYVTNLDHAALSVQSSRWCLISGNTVVNCDRGVTMGDGSAPVTYKSYGNRIENNYFETVDDYIFYLSGAAGDSAHSFVGNIGKNVDAWAFVDGVATYTALTDWQGRTQTYVDPTYGYPYHGWGSYHMGVDAQDDAWLRLNKALPGGGIKLGGRWGLTPN